ncbi:nuclear transport factor 2 family protein [Haloarchaeobius sp. DFWS5]|uniref:nuclear transport factor 2 family protein n=1 Tax=Haloarchaeobius sp. DFWS5 TaxID=3446114 RepID=UPI003EB86616
MSPSPDDGSESDTLSARVARLEARGALKELKAAYCYSIDARDWDRLRSLFTSDAVLDFGGLGTYEGDDGLDRFVREFVEANLDGSAHMVHNPVLDVDGDTATGRWYVESPVTYADGSGGWRQGVYDDEYRRVDGEWRFASVQMRFLYTADFGPDGWPDVSLVRGGQDTL